MCLPPSHLRTETDPVPETSCNVEYRMIDKSKNQLIPSVQLDCISPQKRNGEI
jgi:hypothetical protein